MIGISNMARNARVVRDIVSKNNTEVANKYLDKMINTVNILYTSKQDFVDNFPEENDIMGKAQLIIGRRR
jgi:hypothetical protein